MADSSPIGSGPRPEEAAFVLCIEDNETRGQALLLIESLRAFGGRFAASEIYAVAPRAGLGVDRETRLLLEELEVTYHEEPLNSVCPEYGSANRVYAAAWAAEASRAETLFVLDSDTLFLAEPRPLGRDFDFAARPVDVKGSASSGPGDDFEPYWQALAELAGCDLETLPYLDTALDGQRVRASYNGGYSLVRRGSGILQRAAELFTRSVRAGLSPYAGRQHRVFASTGEVPPRAAELWGSNQAILSLAAWCSTRRVELLDRRYNLPLHHLAGWSGQQAEGWRGIGPIHVHYHWMLRAAHRGQALRTLEWLGATPEQRAFIAARPPIGERKRRPAAAPLPAPPAGGRQLLICGMHRSGTSLVASLLRHAGLEIGKDLIGAGPGNRHGHFEDHELVGLHDDLLAAAGASALAVDDDFAPPSDPEFSARARALVAARAGRPLWGWKDPRTSLFLDFWQPLLPAPSYLFLYRHPLEVALSLRRRGTEIEVRLDPWAGIRAWEVYNRRLLDFLERHPERCFLAQVPALTDDLPGFVARLGGALGLPLGELGDFSPFSPEDLTRSFVGEADLEVWEELIPEALALYRLLEEKADLPGLEPEREAAPAARPAAPMNDGDHPRAARREIAALREDLSQTRVEPGEALPALSAALWRERLGKLERELSHRKEENAELRRRLQELEREGQSAAAQRDELAARIGAIGGSRAYRMLDGWWRLAGRVRKARKT